MHVNHAFLLSQARARGGRILDFGCGEGEMVKAALNQGLDAYGCDTHWDTCDAESAINDSRLIPVAPGTPLPFTDAFFDCVTSNMVFEHVRDLASSLAEIHRVLKPGGWLLAMFPIRESAWEGHTEVPLGHWFGLRWLTFFRRLGFGHGPRDKPAAAWAAHYKNWIGTHCFYRSDREVLALFRAAGFTVSRAEAEHARYRHLPLPGWLFKRLAYAVLFAQKI
jgi:SAM-dependent methyltransferase